MFSIIQTGGKQYKVSKGDFVFIEKIKNAKEGEKIIFDNVLLRVEDEKIDIGTPFLSKHVEGKFIKEGRDKKKIIFRYHSKNRYRKLRGHRQPHLVVEITSI